MGLWRRQFGELLVLAHIDSKDEMNAGNFVRYFLFCMGDYGKYEKLRLSESSQMSHRLVNKKDRLTSFEGEKNHWVVGWFLRNEPLTI